jgi:hypothetical protein
MATPNDYPSTGTPQQPVRRVHWKASPVFEKENVHLMAEKEPKQLFSTPRRKAAASGDHEEERSSLLVTPLRPHQTTPFRSNHNDSESQKVSPLRKHLADLSLQTPRPHLSTGPVRVRKSTPFLSSGPRRVMLPTPAKKSEKQPNIQQRRIGFDGTTGTPSKELLKPTKSSIGQQYHLRRRTELKNTTVSHQKLEEERAHVMLDPTLSSYTTNSVSLNISSLEEDDHSIATSFDGRHGSCDDPVAHILMNDGVEDYDMLLQQDRMMTQQQEEENLTNMNGHRGGTNASPVPVLSRSAFIQARNNMDGGVDIVRPTPTRRHAAARDAFP